MKIEDGWYDLIKDPEPSPHPGHVMFIKSSSTHIRAAIFQGRVLMVFVMDGRLRPRGLVFRCGEPLPKHDGWALIALEFPPETH